MRSRLAPRQILFPRYLPDELLAILNVTVQRAFRGGSWTREILDKIVEHAYGDARRMMALLRHAVQRAEEVGANRLLSGYGQTKVPAPVTTPLLMHDPPLTVTVMAASMSIVPAVVFVKVPSAVCSIVRF